MKKEAQDNLRTLAARDPKRAREWLNDFIDESGGSADALVAAFAGVRDGRVRQLVANVVRTRKDGAFLAPSLKGWLEQETDEFARMAIVAALRSASDSRGETGSANNANTEEDLASNDGLFTDAFLQAYRYAAERLAHRVRNVLPEIQATLARMTQPDQQGNLEAELPGLRSTVARLARVVEFAEGDPEHFRLRTIALGDWVKHMHRRYSSRYSSIPLDVRGIGDLKVSASDYLLETIFWNLWANAHEAVGLGCRLSLELEPNGSYVAIQLLDNGEGFPREMQDVAFELRYSTHGDCRGRGLLEVAEAVSRLQGSVALEERDGRLRIKILLPRTHD
jgi:signal transduction histidine kinase